jgi:hypothetical protein
MKKRYFYSTVNKNVLVTGGNPIIRIRAKSEGKPDKVVLCGHSFDFMENNPVFKEITRQKAVSISGSSVKLPLETLQKLAFENEANRLRGVFY